MTLGEIGARISKAKAHTFTRGPGFRGCCPAHDDQNASFAVWETPDGWLHFKCQTGCSEDDILQALGMTQDDRRTAIVEKVHHRETRYDYQNADGTYAFSKVRKLGNDGKKTFIQGVIQPDGTLRYGLSGINGKLLYRISNIEQAKDTGSPLHICEGEKAVDLLTGMGILATCGPCGADINKPESKWQSEYTKMLEGVKQIVVWADRDETGEVYAKYVAQQVSTVCDDVTVVQSRSTNLHDDVYDHIKSGHGIDQGMVRKDLMPKSVLDLLNVFDASTHKDVALEYLIEPYLPKGKLILVDADGGIGKTSLEISLAAALSNGVDPIHGVQIETGKTLFLGHGEDSDEELATIYCANGGKDGHIAFYQEDLSFDQDGINMIRSMIKHYKPKLLVCDGIFDFAPVKVDINNPKEAARLMKPIQKLALETGITALVSRHVSKDSDTKSASNRGMGSAMIRNKARGQLGLGWHTDQQRYRGVVVVQDLRGSVLRQAGEPFCFRRVGNMVEYIQSGVDLSSYTGDAQAQKRGPNATSVDAAADVLREVLDDGPLHFAEARTQVMNRTGCSERTVYRAKEQLGLYDINQKWHLPDDDDPYL